MRFLIRYTSHYMNPAPGWPIDMLAGVRFPELRIREHEVRANSKDEFDSMLPDTITVHSIYIIKDSINVI